VSLVLRSRRHAVLLAALFLLLHAWSLPASLDDLDSMNFAMGVRHFDVARHQPHPPGYPLYIAAAKSIHALVRDEATLLGLLSAVSGALGLLSLVLLFSRIDPAWPAPWPLVAALTTATCPLYWLTATRPLSDVPGLAASIAVQGFVLAAASDGALVGASFLAALATGIRSQAAWLIWPLLALALLQHRTARRRRFLLQAGAAFAGGGLLWAVPLVIVSGGPSAYWRALFAQGAEDLSGIEMLWTRPTPREAVRALYFAFVAPWGSWVLAAGVLVFAATGAWLLYRRARGAWLPLAVAFGPYFIFDVLFQETFTSRYALPLVPPVAYLATRAIAVLPRPAAIAAAVAGAGFATSISWLSASAYSMTAAPAFRALRDISEAAKLPQRAHAAPVLAMHRREDLDLRRPLEWMGPDVPAFSQRLAAPAKHEWLELVKYWNAGGRAAVWFVADPLRTDLALIEPPARRPATYRWPLEYPVLLSGVRPNEMDWHVFDAPGWYLGEGWSLTPETAGVAGEDRRGPGLAPIEGWIRRRSEAVTVMIGGRNLDAGTAAITVRVDGKQAATIDARPGFFLQFVELPEGALAGAGAYARLTVAADRPPVTIEQFDAQSSSRLIFGFGDGWHEMEYNPATGRRWRWVGERGVIRLRARGRPVVLRMTGETENVPEPTTISIRVGDRLVGQAMAGREFTVQAPLPADLLTAPETAVTIESSQYFVPAEHSRRTQDRRHLALRVRDVEIRAAP
jgi:hypothetical protein